MIIGLAVFNCNRIAKSIVNHGGAISRHFHPHHGWLALFDSRFDLRLGGIAAVSVVANRLLGLTLLLAHGVEPFGGTNTAVGRTTGDELVDMLMVNMEAFGLAIRAMGAADIGTFIPF